MAVCIVCQVPAVVYCHNDDAFLCSGCDEKIHSASIVAKRHERVQICGVCTVKASTVFCKNDNTFFCDGCNTNVHLKNPLACRHTVVPSSTAQPSEVGTLSTSLSLLSHQTIPAGTQ